MKTIKEKNIINVLASRSVDSRIDTNFQLELQKKLRGKSKYIRPNILDILIMKNQSIEFKILTLFIALTTISILVTSVTNPVLANNIISSTIECKFDVMCYGKWTEDKNKHGIETKYIENDGNGGGGFIASVKFKDYIKVTKYLQWNQVAETNEYIEFKTTRGSIFRVFKTSNTEDNAYSQFIGGFLNDSEDLNSELFGEKYKLTKDQSLIDYYNQLDIIREKMLKQDFDKLTQKEREEYFRNLISIKTDSKGSNIPENNGKYVSTFEFNGREFRREFYSSPTGESYDKFYDVKTDQLLVNLQILP